MKTLSSNAKYLFFVENVIMSVFVPLILLGMVILSATLHCGCSQGGAVANMLVWSAIVFIFYLLICFIFAELKYRFWQYELRENSITIRRGIIFKQTVDIPYSKIQNITTKEPLIYRMFGLRKVLIETAGQTAASGEEAEGILPGLNENDTRALKDAVFSNKESSN